jgi:diguanylate cyclase (GGDEF)-like protein
MDSSQTDLSILGSSECAREPVHLIGQIQDHGVLFALTAEDGIVRWVSANVETVLGLSTAAVLGAPFHTVIGAQQWARFERQTFTDDHFANALPLVVGAEGRAINCLAHRQDGLLIVEFESLSASPIEPINFVAQVRMLTQMERLPDLRTLGDFVVGQIHALTEFERVMIYQFDANYNGEVIAEITSTTFGSFLGLHFPASDIPVQARRLFLLNTLRAIADIDSQPVAIVAQDTNAAPLDLTYAYLRSASPIHLQYLRNMGVQSTMTASIIVKGQLWGLIACHHPTVHTMDFSLRTLCEVIASFFASQIALRLDNRELQLQLRFRKNLADYLTVIDASKALADAEFRHSTRLLDLLDADGVISCIDRAVLVQGVTVDIKEIQPAITILAQTAVDGIASCYELGAIEPGAKRYAADVSGALYMELTEGTGDYLLLLRQELVRTAHWAGNPDKAMIAEVGGLRPRTSFASWLQTVHGQSRPWTMLELDNAAFLREQLMALRAAQKSHDIQDHIRYLATHDGLTGLINRLSLQHTIEQNINDAIEHRTGFSVLFIDLDNFKVFNDTMGHATGDSILKIAAARMLRQVRSQDSVGRFGGDEFVVIIPGALDDYALDDYALRAGSRILRALEEPMNVDRSAELRVTASIGVSSYPLDGTTAEELLARSDTAMYRAKLGGGNSLSSSKGALSRSSVPTVRGSEWPASEETKEVSTAKRGT